MTKIVALSLFFLALKSYALIGGVDVSDFDPLSKSVVALQMVEKLNSGEINLYKGSGVLVGPNVILTAGHNFFYLADVTMSEAIFSTHPRWGKDALGQKRIFVEKVILFPGFSQSPLGTRNDLALVFLRDRAPYPYRPLPVELDGRDSPNRFEQGILLGYGRSIDEPTAPVSDYHLRRLSLEFARWDKSTIFDSQKIWFSNRNGSIAAGDSGGPVLFKRDGGGYRIYGIGIHHRYDDCVKENTCESESAYSNTTYFSDWIKNHSRY